MRRRSTLRSKAFVSLALLVGALLNTNAASAQQITLISSASDGTPGSEVSVSPSISADGRFVAFVSAADNLVPNDTNQTADVFVKDRVSGTTTRVSVTTAGEQVPL
jgi:Tol biopolymer transport system component